MKFQREDYDCGPTSLTNAIKALGFSVSEYHVEMLSKPDPDNGTPEWRLVEAAKSLGFKAAKFKFTNVEKAWLWLLGCLSSGMTVILCVENWEHWVTAIAINGENVIVIDPAKTAENKAENGVVIAGREKLKKWWNHGGNYYGIAVMK